MGDSRNWALLRLNQNDFSVENRTGGTHPGTEQCPVRGCLMLSMVPSMFCSLYLSQAANRENAEHKSD